MEDYIYDPLPTQPGRIRLMRLLPSATDTDAIRCGIFPAKLGDGQQYTALSYCWGDAHKPHHIVVAGCRLAITASLHGALTRMRGRESYETLWADAVCINQADAAEKSWQVAQMHQVYRRAERVICWLGPGGGDDELALAWARDFGEQARRHGFDKADRVALWPLLSLCTMSLEGCARLEHWQKTTGLADGLVLTLYKFYQSLFVSPSNPYNLRSALEKFLRNDYWQRAWIVQEIYNARELKFVCGQTSVDERDLVVSLEFLRFFHEHRLMKANESTFDEVGSFQANTVLRNRGSVAVGASLPLIHLLRQFRRSKTHLPVDKIYSMLNMAGDSSELGIMPDYTISWQDCFVQVAQALLRNGYTEILSFCNSTDRLTDLPSWVPDWGDPGAREFLVRSDLLTSGVSELQPKLDAAAGLPRWSDSSFSTQHEILSMSSVRLGVISKQGAWYNITAPRQWLEENISLAPPEPADVRQRLRNACAVVVNEQSHGRGDHGSRADPKLLGLMADSDSTALLTDLCDYLAKNGISDFAGLLWSFARHGKAIAVDNTHIGLAADHAEVGDEVHIVAGVCVPLVFRKILGTSNMSLVGEAYVHGAMNGEISAHGEANLQQITVA